MAKRLELPMERVIVTVQDHGNTSTASSTLALDAGMRDGRVKRGDLLLLEAFGGGFTWGSALVRFQELAYRPDGAATFGTPLDISLRLEIVEQRLARPAASPAVSLHDDRAIFVHLDLRDAGFAFL